MDVSTRNPENIAAERVLAMLQSWSDRFQRHVRQKRTHQRRPCNIRTTCIVQDNTKSSGELADSIDVWMRNISRAGVGFITHGQLRTTNGKIVLKLGEKHFLCQIRRSRQVHDGFLEYGATFIEEAVV